MKEWISNNKKIFIGIVIGLLIGIGGVSADEIATILSSSEVSYSNEDMDATNVQDAIDELYNYCTPSLTTVYARHTSQKTIGQSTITDSEYQSDYTKIGYPAFLKYEIDSNNVIQKAYTCLYDSSFGTFCIQGGKSDYYLNNKNILENWESYVSGNWSYTEYDSYSKLYNNSYGMSLSAYKTGGVEARAAKKGMTVPCEITNNNIAYCSEGSGTPE